MSARREPRRSTTRIGILPCTWRLHPKFIEDVKCSGVDAASWSSIKQAMTSAANVTSRGVDWEYPCTSANGAIGELKVYHQSEISYVNQAVGKVTDSITVHYRIYFAEPRLCPQELWAMGFGHKASHIEYVGTEQQSDIRIAQLRASQTHPGGTAGTSPTTSA